MFRGIERGFHALVIVAMLGGGVAHAQGAPVAPASSSAAKARAKAFVAKASAAYKAQDFEAALVGYTKAYDEFPLPALMFNIAQCHRQLKHYALALEAYNSFVLYGTPSDADRASVAELVAQVKRDRDAQRAAEDKAIVARRVAAQPVETSTTVATRTPAPVTPSRPIYKRWWFWTAVGTVALAAGGAYYMTRDTAELPEGSIGRLDRR